MFMFLESKFYEFEPCLKSAKNRFQFSADLNLKTLNMLLIGTNHIWATSQIKAAAQIRPLMYSQSMFLGELSGYVNRNT